MAEGRSVNQPASLRQDAAPRRSEISKIRDQNLGGRSLSIKAESAEKEKNIWTQRNTDLVD
jgi:hypothetical protein